MQSKKNAELCSLVMILLPYLAPVILVFVPAF